MTGSRIDAFWERVGAHPWLVGDDGIPGRRLARRARWMTIAAVATADAIGAAIVIAFGLLALPKPEGVLDVEVYLVNLAAGVGYLLVALPIGIAWGRRRIETGPHGMRDWVVHDRVPTPAERLHVLRAPQRIMTVQMVLWGGAVVVFTLLNGLYDWLLALGVGLTVALGGLTTSAAAYFLSEIALRPVASRALASGPVDRKGVPGVAMRWMLSWALGTAVPVFGLALIGIVALTPVDISETTLGVTMVALAGIGIGIGLLVSVLAAYATVHPIGSIRRALARVRGGDLDVELGVWDSTEMGLLQAGFNDMVHGLRERERMREVFGRQVGEDVARKALAEDVRLGGEVREVAVLFVDITGSTTLAADHPPEAVVELLNRFFAVVVDVVEEAGGWINKFVGDAALAVFGAPIALPEAATCALTAARRLDERLRAEVAELEAGIGVASGGAVAGHIGAERRFEYTVIGDPVNQAARLSDLAKSRSPRVLAAGATVERGSEAERARWAAAGEEVLRGRREPTPLHAPAAGDAGERPGE